MIKTNNNLKYLKIILKLILNLNNDAPIIWVNNETGKDPTIRHIINVLDTSSLTNWTKKYLKKKLLVAIDKDEPYDENIKSLSKFLKFRIMLGNVNLILIKLFII